MILVNPRGSGSKREFSSKTGVPSRISDEINLPASTVITAGAVPTVGASGKYVKGQRDRVRPP